MRLKAICIIILFFVSFQGIQAQTIRRVPSVYPTIQAGINAAIPGDTVLVANGTYTGPGNVNIDFLGKAITVTSENGPFYTSIDAQDVNRGVLFISNETASSILKGFWIRNCFADATAAGDGGAGILCKNSSPTIKNCIIKYCWVLQGNGGGMHIIDGSPTLEYCTFYQTGSDYNGGAVYILNTSPGGNVVAPLFDHCDFIQNFAESQRGGGIYNENSQPSIGNCQFILNSAHLAGGGIYNDNSNSTQSPIIWNSAFFWNNEYSTSSNGGAIYNNASSPAIGNCTFTENGGMECIYNSIGSRPVILNSILYNDYGNELGGPGVPNITYSDVEGGWTGMGNIDDDPVFAGSVTPSGNFDGDIHICWNSPCRDTGLNYFNPFLLTDIDGNPRPTYTYFDMGADEFDRQLYAVPDYRILPFFYTGGTGTIRMVGQPGWQCFLYMGTGVFNPPITTPFGNVYLQNPQLLLSSIIPSPSGIVDWPRTVPLSPPGPYELPMQALAANLVTNLLIIEVVF